MICSENEMDDMSQLEDALKDCERLRNENQQLRAWMGKSDRELAKARAENEKLLARIEQLRNDRNA